jgi:plastocyanin
MKAFYFILAALPLINAQYGDVKRTTSASSMAASASASSTVHKVDVGEDGFTFHPDTLIVSPGESVEFHFYPQNHSVAQASFDNPCHPANATGFSSGFVPTTQESKTVFTVTINDTAPIWYYCGQIGHCQAGMVGVINAPSGGQETLENFKLAAANARGSTIPATVQGGLLGETKEPTSSTATQSTSQTTGSATSSTSSVTSSTGSATSSTSSGSNIGTAVGMAIVMALSCFVSMAMI